MKRAMLILLSVLVHLSAQAASLRHTITHTDAHTLLASLLFDNESDEKLYKDSLQITVDHPDIILSKPQANHELQQWPGKKLHDTERGWQGPVTITISATYQADHPPKNAHLHVSYTTSKQLVPAQEIIALPYATSATGQIPQENDTSQELERDEPKEAHQPVTQESKKSSWPSISSYVKGLVKSTESPWIRLLLVFLLGILMSLTPCIYPMIPITIGILQSQAGDSTQSNALRALMYTTGMGITYALFGLLASCTGPLCGYIFSQPIFVLCLVALLMYFGLCMFGFIEMYIPRFLQMQRSHKGGSLFAAFLFGLASGTLASPCVSPGLALILSIVATMGNKLMGFALLFAFGVGLSMPLLIVGLSAGSLHLLPRAGMWMIEIKKLFGFLLFALAFYYLSAIVSLEYLFYFIALFLFSMGIYYIYSSYYTAIPFWKKINALLGMVLIIAGVSLGAQALQTKFLDDRPMPEPDIWLTDYSVAREQALRDKKLLFIDVWADFCSICIAINKTLLKEPLVLEMLTKHFVPLKVNGTNPQSEPYASVHAQFAITGFPTYLIVDPATLAVKGRWESSIYKMDPAVFVAKLQKRLS